MTTQAVERNHYLFVDLIDAPWVERLRGCVRSHTRSTVLHRASDLESFDAVVLRWTTPQATGAQLDKLARVYAEDLPPIALACDDTLDPGLCDLIGRGALDALIDTHWPAPLIEVMLDAAVQRVRLGRGLAEVQGQVIAGASARAVELQRLVFRDDLTELFNLRHFREALRRETAHAQRHGLVYALVYVDVDGLRAINERYGHAAGSLVLRHVGSIIARVTRGSDYPCRVGGDEFITLLTQCTAAGAETYAAHLLTEIARQPLSLPGSPVTLTASAGVAVFPEDAEDPAALLRYADSALFAAKERGKNTSVRFRRSLMSAAKIDLSAAIALVDWPPA